jgi:AraC-like DNA-binding protein/mannose-6-phosphate isomerase-like protein (cupin superfamily)
MKKTPLPSRQASGPFNCHDNDSRTALELGRVLREQLVRAAATLRRGDLKVHVPASGGGSETEEMEGHFHLATELFIQVAGWTRFQFPEEQIMLRAGEALLIPPKLVHAEVVGRDEQGEAFSNIVIYADETILTCHLAHELMPGVPRVQHMETSSRPQRIYSWFNDIAKIAQSNPHEQVEGGDIIQTQVHGLLLAAIAQVLQQLETDPSPNKTEPVQITKLRALIQQQLGDHQLSVRDLAEQLSCTPDHLSRLFHQSAGEHLVAYINRLRMARAAHLLRDSELSLKEIGWSCGYASQSYFIRMFRTHFDMTPKSWRAHQR